jgi:hypothetical protein
MMQAIVELRNQGRYIDEKDITRLSPLLFAHINIYRGYSFELAGAVANGELRTLQVDWAA